MQVGERAYGGIYAGECDSNMIICSPIEYELPVEVNWFQAVNYCNLVGMDLPTKEELNLLHELYKVHPEYFPNREYYWNWSSTESSTTGAYMQIFCYGTQSALIKTMNLNVRPIKRIKI